MKEDTKYKVSMILRRKYENLYYRIKNIVNNTEIILDRIDIDGNIEIADIGSNIDYVEEFMFLWKDVSDPKYLFKKVEEPIDKDKLFWDQHQTNWIKRNCPDLNEDGTPKQKTVLSTEQEKLTIIENSLHGLDPKNVKQHCPKLYKNYMNLTKG